jgi:hypothetical protein
METDIESGSRRKPYAYRAVRRDESLKEFDRIGIRDRTIQLVRTWILQNGYFRSV